MSATVLKKKDLPDQLNLEPQHYKNFIVTLMGGGFITAKAARFRLFNTKQNIWIPRKHLDETFTIKPGERLEYIFCSPDVANKMALIINELQYSELSKA